MKRDCEIIRELAFEARRAGTGPEDKLAIREHLASCADCRSQLQWIEGVAEAIDFRGATLDPAREARLHAAIKPLFEEMAAEQLRRRRRFAWPLPVALAMAAAALLAVGLWWRMTPPAATVEHAPESPLAAQVTSRSGEVEVSGQALGREVEPGSVVVARRASFVALQLVEDRAVVLAQSEVRIAASTTRRASLQLRRGSVHVQVKKGAGRHFSVEAPFGLVEVTGTRFAVSAEHGGRVTTLAGSVRVTLKGRAPVMVRAGQTLDASTAKLRRAESQLLAPLRQSFETPAEPLAGAATLLVTGKPAGAAVTLDGKRVGHAPFWLRRTPGRVAYVISSEKGIKRGTVALQAGSAAVVRYDFSPSSRPTTRPSGRPFTGGHALVAGRAKLTALVQARDCVAAQRIARGSFLSSSHARAEAMARVAECYQTRKEHGRALAIYRQIAKRYGRTPTAANALFEIGRLSSAAKQNAVAKRAFGRYLRKHPHHPLAADARFRLCRLDIEAKRYASAVRCLLAYRKRFPRGARHAETLYLEARMRKDALSDCRGALKLYQRYLAAKAPRKRVEAARFGRLDCLRRLSDGRFAAEARAYLRAHARSTHASAVRRWLGH